jgi:thiosulfate reductase cytochrome b subunit
MWLYVGTGVLYVGYSVVSGTYRTLLFRPCDVSDLWPMLAYYLQLRRQPPAYEKYNPLQRLAYTLMVLTGVCSVLTGIVLYKPVQLDWLTRLPGGYQYTRLWHFLLVWVFAVFLLVHLIMVALSGWSNFLAMITGWKTARGGELATVSLIGLPTATIASAPFSSVPGA